MSDSQDFNKVERQIYRSYYQDGVLDIGVGLAILLFGLGEISASHRTGFFPLLFAFTGPFHQSVSTGR